MPTYDFRCKQGHTTERSIHLDGGSPPQVIVCADCKHPALRVYTKPMVPLLGDDAAHRRRRRPMSTDVTTADGGKARKRL